MERLGKYWWVFGLLAVISGIPFVVLNWGKAYPEYEMLDTISCNDYLFIAASAWYIKQYLPQMPMAHIYLAVAVAGFAGALLLNEIVSRIPVIRWCVLGIKKSKK